MIKREIKFRAWLTELEVLIPAEQVLGFVSEPINEKMTHDRILQYSNLPLKGGYVVEKENSEYYVLMQFTGLLDKNGKEIYEGDIVKCFRSLDEEAIDIHLGVVEWNKIHCNYYFKSIKNEISRSVGGKEKIEIIGNIYENPEKLKK